MAGIHLGASPMPYRPLTVILVLVVLVFSGALLTAAVTSGHAGQRDDPGRLVLMGCCAVAAGMGGFKVGRMLAAGQLTLGARLCRSCNAKRTTRAAFCESCHRRD